MPLLRQSLLAQRLDAIISLATRGGVTRQTILTADFLLAQRGNTAVYYAPMHYVNAQARVIIVGITPGWTQTELAFSTFARAVSEGASVEAAACQAKYRASFAGVMRSNLVNMLDDLGVNRRLDLASADGLFGPSAEFLDTGSILTFPVFNRERNYTGHSPALRPGSWLWSFTDTFQEQLGLLDRVLVVPLGRMVDSALGSLRLPRSAVLMSGFPHPSGANGHRLRDFVRNRPQLLQAVDSWASAF